MYQYEDSPNSDDFDCDFLCSKWLSIVDKSESIALTADSRFRSRVAHRSQMALCGDCEICYALPVSRILAAFEDVVSEVVEMCSGNGFVKIVLVVKGVPGDEFAGVGA